MYKLSHTRERHTTLAGGVALITFLCALSLQVNAGVISVNTAKNTLNEAVFITLFDGMFVNDSTKSSTPSTDAWSLTVAEDTLDQLETGCIGDCIKVEGQNVQGSGPMLGPIYFNSRPPSEQIQGGGEKSNNQGGVDKAFGDYRSVAEWGTSVVTDAMGDRFFDVNGDGVYSDVADADGFIDIRLTTDTAWILKSTLERVPEPASIALLGLGLAGLCFSRYRKG